MSINPEKACVVEALDYRATTETLYEISCRSNCVGELHIYKNDSQEYTKANSNEGVYSMLINKIGTHDITCQIERPPMR